jgi:hypothetical protein
MFNVYRVVLEVKLLYHLHVCGSSNWLILATSLACFQLSSVIREPLGYLVYLLA